jgi:hypothetical protein
MSAETPLAKYEAFRRALAEAKSVDEVKDIRNKAEAIRAYARQANDKTLEIDAAEIRITAERRLGQMIVDQKSAVGLAKGGGDKRSKQRVQRRPGDPPTLAEAGIGKHLADRARKWAAISEEDFAKYLARWRGEATRANDRVTIGILRAAGTEQSEELFERQMAEKQKDPRRDFSPLWDLDNEDESDEVAPLPSARELDRQRYQRLLETNLSAPAEYEPRKYNSVAKIVAEGLVRLDVIRDYIDQPSARQAFAQTFDAMDDRLNRLLAGIAKAGAAEPIETGGSTATNKGRNQC